MHRQQTAENLREAFYHRHVSFELLCFTYQCSFGQIVEALSAPAALRYLEYHAPKSDFVSGLTRSRSRRACPDPDDFD